MIKLKQYRDIWMSEKFDEFIGFYNREFYCLDNFSAFKVEYNNIIYSTVEEAYQAQKFIGVAPEIHDMIVNSKSSHEAKVIAHDNEEFVRPDWEQIKVDIMEELLRAKVSQHPYVRKKLLETIPYRIVEDSNRDSFYGCGEDRNGQNIMGELWMKIRNEIEKEHVTMNQ